MYQTILLDVDNTLTDFNESAKVAINKSFQEIHLSLPENVYDTFFETNDALWLEIEKGNLTREKLHSIRWQLILEKLSLPFNGQEMEKIFLKNIALSPCMMPGAIDLLQYLYPKYTVCLATNAPVSQQTKRLEKTEIPRYVHHIFISEDVGCPKPEKGFFAEVFNRLKTADPKKTLMIGDSLTADIAGGIAYGIPTCWFNPKNKPLPEGIKPTYIVNRLEEIKAIL